MEPLRIAHLSDLHFGVQNDGTEGVWNALVDFINNDLEPNLVVVTGDIVNTPDKEAFAYAKSQLDLLRPRSIDRKDSYRLCPGNHDRFTLGNSPGGGIRRFLSWLSRYHPDPGAR